MWIREDEEAMNIVVDDRIVENDTRILVKVKHTNPMGFGGIGRLRLLKGLVHALN